MKEEDKKQLNYKIDTLELEKSSIDYNASKIIDSASNIRSKRNIAKRNYEELVNPKSWTNPSKELGNNSTVKKLKLNTLNTKKISNKQKDNNNNKEDCKSLKKSNSEKSKIKISPVKKENAEINNSTNISVTKNISRKKIKKPNNKVNIFSSFEFFDSKNHQEKNNFNHLDMKTFDGVSTINYFNNFNINLNGYFDSDFNESLRRIHMSRNNPNTESNTNPKPRQFFGKKRKLNYINNPNYSQETNLLKENLTKKINSKLMQCTIPQPSNNEMILNDKGLDDEKPTVNLKLASELKKQKNSFKIDKVKDRKLSGVIDNNNSEQNCNISNEKLSKNEINDKHSVDSKISSKVVQSSKSSDTKNSQLKNEENVNEKNESESDLIIEEDKNSNIKRVKFFKGRRRSKKQESGRVYKCECGKSYLSETALNNHKITKHKYHNEKRSKGRPKKADVFIDGISFDKYNAVFTSNPLRSHKKINVIEVVYENSIVLDIYINSFEKIALSGNSSHLNEVLNSFYSNMINQTKSKSIKTNGESSCTDVDAEKDKEYDSLMCKNVNTDLQQNIDSNLKININEFILEKNLNVIFQRIYIMKKIWLSTLFNNFYSRINIFENIDVNKYDRNPLFKGLLRNINIVDDPDLISELKNKYELNNAKYSSNNQRKKSQFNLSCIQDESIEKKLLEKLLSFKVEFQVKDSKEEIDEFNKCNKKQESLKENKIDNCIIKYLCFMGSQTNLNYFNYVVMVFVLFREYLINESTNISLEKEKEKNKELYCNNNKSDAFYKCKNGYGSIDYELNSNQQDLNLFNNLENIKRESDEDLKYKKPDETHLYDYSNEPYRRDRSLSLRRNTFPFPVILVESSIEESISNNNPYHKISEDNLFLNIQSDLNYNYYDNDVNLRKQTLNNEYSDIKNNNSNLKRKNSDVSSSERRFSLCNFKYLEILDEINNKEFFKSNIENDELLDFTPQELFNYYELFITDYLEPNNFFDINDPEEIVQIIAHFTYWLNSYGYTKFRVGIVNI